MSHATALLFRLKSLSHWQTPVFGIFTPVSPQIAEMATCYVTALNHAGLMDLP